MIARRKQLSLFEPRAHRPPAVAVRTSIAAAEAIAAAAPTLRGRVYAVIVAAGESGATREEVVTATGIALQTVCGRANELLEQGLIFDSGRTRPGKSGRQQVVLAARRNP